MDKFKLNKAHEKYSEYKDSGVGWIGYVPSQWEISKVKNYFNLIKTRSFDNDEKEILSLTLNGIIKRDISNNEGQIASTYEGYRRIYKGDIVLNPMDLLRGFADSSRYEGLISPAYTTLRKKKKEIDSDYFGYFFKKHYNEGIFHPFGVGVSVDHRWTLKDTTLMNFSAVYPSVLEQEKIAKYLDEKIGLIDRIIEKKERLIKLLEEKNMVFIDNIIKKGSTFNEKVVGVEYIKLKYLSKKPLQYGANEAGLDENYLQPRFIRITDIDKVGNLRNDVFKSVDIKIAEPYLLNDGDLLFARTGGTVGKTFLYKKEWGSCCFAGYLIRMSPNKNKVIPSYIEIVTKSNYYWKWIDSIFIRSTIQNVSAEKYKDFLVPLQGLQEQEEVIKTYNKSNKEYCTVIDNIEKSIELLKEYKTSLISNIVTGKVKI